MRPCEFPSFIPAKALPIHRTPVLIPWILRAQGNRRSLLSLRSTPTTTPKLGNACTVRSSTVLSDSWHMVGLPLFLSRKLRTNDLVEHFWRNGMARRRPPPSSTPFAIAAQEPTCPVWVRVMLPSRAYIRAREAAVPPSHHRDPSVSSVFRKPPGYGRFPVNVVSSSDSDLSGNFGHPKV